MIRPPVPLLLLALTGCGPGAAAWDVVINEFQADNVSTLPDEAGQFEDWVELHNPGSAEVDLTGHFLTDDLTNPTRWQLPDGTTIDAGGYLLVWCDDDASDGPLHATFSLSADGESIGLFAPLAAEAAQIDAVDYDAQAADASMSRRPDGSDSWQEDLTPTPEATNE